MKKDKPDKWGFYFYWDKSTEHSRPKPCRLIPFFETFHVEFGDKCVDIRSLPDDALWEAIKLPKEVENFYHFNWPDQFEPYRKRHGKI